MRILSFDIGIKNLAFCDCDIHADVVSQKNIGLEKGIMLHEWDVLDISNKSGTKGNNINEHTPRLLHMLNTLFAKEKLSLYSAIVIENQPSLKNPIMKSIQMIVFTFFHMMKLFYPDDACYEVHLISASNKIKVLHFLPPPDKKTIEEIMQIKCPDTKKGYKYNKTLAKQLATHMMNTNIVDTQSYSDTNAQNIQKKDDLADCLLQACIFALQNK